MTMKRKKAKSIMIQGTMSNAGKSLIVAGLCRIFAQDGYKVAPFKSQNMALNSFITKEGLEMGRAQVVQAQACGVEPSVKMNPILLKPTTDMGSQVIVNGKVQGNMRAMDYFKKKKDYIPVIKKAYEQLASEYDIIVIEGAGSPAEINLKQDDIVNMGMAAIADAPVLLVGDIDRGGVFAQLYGTVELLNVSEKERIKGLIINKFRGDEEILKPGLSMLHNLCKKKVVGVIPYLNVDIEEEDSLAEELSQKVCTKAIDIAVIRFPKISNFTDMQALSMEKNISVRYVNKKSELGNPDVIILPGTKNTMKDLLWLRESGLEGTILRLVSKGSLLFGICGGYQMLGEKITDVNGIEGNGSIRGLGLIPMNTIFEPEKTRTQIEGITLDALGSLAILSGKKIKGYEIHMGRSIFTQEHQAFAVFKGKKDGYWKENVIGTYLHGVFDEEEFRKAFLKFLFQKKGLDPKEISDLTLEEYHNQQYDLLADGIRSHLDMKEVYRILEKGGSHA